MDHYIRELPVWPGATLPVYGALLFYDPATDQEYQVLPGQLGLASTPTPTPGGSVVVTDLPGARQLLPDAAASPPRVGAVQAGGFYAVYGDWNATGSNAVVYVDGLSASAFSPVGVLRDAAGAYSFVQVDVVAGTTQLLSGGSFATRDLLDLSTEFMDAVMALTYTDCDADPAASPDGSFPGQQFDAKGPDGQNRHYYCTRSTYTPATPGSGVGPAWHCVLKSS